MSYWNGNLLNRPADVLTDIILLMLIIAAYLPQITRLRQSESAQGISPYFVLFNIIFSNAHLSESLALAAYAWPSDRRPVLEQVNDGSLRGLPAFGSVLGLLQITVQWICSVALLLSYVRAASLGGRSTRFVSITAFLHAAVVLFPMVARTLPKPARHEMGGDIILALTNMSNLVVAPCFLLLQFCAQFLELRRQHGRPGALSLLSIILQAAVFLAVGIRWFIRLGKPAWEEGDVPKARAPLSLWYIWGFIGINYVIYALGCAVLLLAYRMNVNGSLEDGDPAYQTLLS